ncbi:MAG: hypothetical protein KBS83_07075 [Lachnospiraceae bacterium]|nr:hypothetical protein [Candidatus Equihabitans merdae]
MTMLNETAAQFETIYEEFTNAIRALGSKVKGGKRKGKFGSKLARMLGGELVTTERDRLSEEFLDKVVANREKLLEMMQEASLEEQQEAAAIACDILMQVRPVESDSTTDLMKRAMIGQAESLLPYLSQEKVGEIHERISSAYTKRQMLPVESNMLKALKKYMA